MSKLGQHRIPSRDSIGLDFDEEDDILNFRPHIEFVLPDTGEAADFLAPEDEGPTIDSLRKRTEDLIKNYKAVRKLADAAQTRVDTRVKAAGGMSVKLDPTKAADASVIAAMKRCFPEKADPTVITYECYKKCLDSIRTSDQVEKASDLVVKPEDIRAAKTDPLRTDFGGSKNRAGENRPELSSPGGGANNIDLDAFQAAAVIALFGLLLPMIKTEDKAEVAQHLVTAKHF